MCIQLDVLKMTFNEILYDKTINLAFTSAKFTASSEISCLSGKIFVENVRYVCEVGKTCTTGIQARIRYTPPSHMDNALYTRLGYGKVFYTQRLITEQNICIINYFSEKKYDVDL